ncbi:MAG TPA: hypothetical protein VIZ43_29270, partial [Trebonia sp.]
GPAPSPEVAGETPPQAPAPPQAAQPGGGQRPAPVQPSGPGAAAAPQRPAPAFTHAPGAPGSPDAQSAAAAPRGGTVTLDMLRQAWPSVVESIKAKGRVAAIVIGNASVASFDEGVLTLRFPRQGDVKGFQGSKYEDLLKQALNAMFGINAVIRAVTGGGDAASPARRPAGPGPAGPAPHGQTPASPYGQSPPAQPPAPPDHSQPPAPPTAQAYPGGPGGAPGVAGQAVGSTGNDGGGGANPFRNPVGGGGDLPPLPPPPPPDDEDFDPDEDMSSSATVNELTGMALVQRELGAEIIAEYDD